MVCNRYQKSCLKDADMSVREWGWGPRTGYEGYEIDIPKPRYLANVLPFVTQEAFGRELAYFIGHKTTKNVSSPLQQCM